MYSYLTPCPLALNLKSLFLLSCSILSLDICGIVLRDWKKNIILFVYLDTCVCLGMTVCSYWSFCVCDYLYRESLFWNLPILSRSFWLSYISKHWLSFWKISFSSLGSQSVDCAHNLQPTSHFQKVQFFWDLFLVVEPSHVSQ